MNLETANINGFETEERLHHAPTLKYGTGTVGTVP